MRIEFFGPDGGKPVRSSSVSTLYLSEDGKVVEIFLDDKYDMKTKRIVRKDLKYYFIADTNDVISTEYKG